MLKKQFTYSNGSTYTLVFVLYYGTFTIKYLDLYDFGPLAEAGSANSCTLFKVAHSCNHSQYLSYIPSTT